MKYNRALPLFVPLLTWILSEVYFSYHRFIYIASSVIFLLLLITFWRFSKESLIDKAWWNFFILPGVFSFSVIAYSTVVDNVFLIQLLFFINLIIQYFYLRFSYYYLIRPVAYKISAIENLSSYVNFLSYFLMAATIYGLQSYLNMSVWPLMLVMAASSAVIIYQSLWAYKINIKEGLAYLAIGCLVLLEVGWVITFLPLNYNVLGLVLAICFYLIMGLVRLKLLDISSKEKIRLYLSFSLLSIVIILLTARWL